MINSTINVIFSPFCLSFMVCCNNPAHGPPGYRLHNDKNGIISALLEYHCLLAAAAAATDAIDVTIFELSDEDTGDNVEFSTLAHSSSDGVVILVFCPLDMRLSSEILKIKFDAIQI